jgi:hypothetical protein
LLRDRASHRSPSLGASRRKQVEQRLQRLEERRGGAWLGSLWRWRLFVAQWHRGLMAVKLRTRMHAGTLLGLLAGLPGSPCLRSLSIHWPLRLLHRPEGEGSSSVPAVSEGFLAALLAAPVCRHLTHLGTSRPFLAEQTRLIRHLGVEPVHVESALWMHRLPPAAFRGRSPGASSSRPLPVTQGDHCPALLITLSPASPHPLTTKEPNMTSYTGGADPPRTLAERLSRLNDNLQALGERLKTSIAGLVGDAIAEAVRDAVRGLLGSKEAPGVNAFRDERDDRQSFHSRDYRDADAQDPWAEGERRWPGQDDHASRWQRDVQRQERPKRWRNALGAAVESALWWLKTQPKNRPVLTTLAVALAAGVTGFIAGPVLAAGAGVLASVAGLLLTANATQSAAELASG